MQELNDTTRNEAKMRQNLGIPLKIKSIRFFFFILLLYVVVGCSVKQPPQLSPDTYKFHNFVYTAFVQSGEKKVVIINNKEYEIGDVIDDSGYVLVDIASRRLTVFNNITGNRMTVLHVNQGL